MKKRSTNIKKKKIIIIGLFLVLIILIGLLFGPSFIENFEVKKLKQEVSNVGSMIDRKDIDMKMINSYLKNDITTGQRKNVESAIEKYLKDIVDDTMIGISVSKDKDLTGMLSVKNIESNSHDFTNDKKKLSDMKKKLDDVKSHLETVDEMSYMDTSKDKEMIHLYKKLLSKDIGLKKSIQLVSDMLSVVDTTNKGIEYLDANKNDWKIEDNKLIFMKRNKFHEYQAIIDKMLDRFKEYISLANLIKDDTPPVIDANDITITQGTSLEVKDKIKCIDEVDGDVECKISGEYDTNQVGEYSIKIEATDQSNHTSNKTIKIKVNERVIYKNPYYTEVIRNQNTVIVYGLDENNEYTRIVRVMPCSVGRSGQDTPTGIFTTSDKYRWGGLYGGVFGQYSTRIVSDILFHSVPYYSQNPGDLEWEEYNKLGTPASLGCVRMSVIDVKWIFENCPSGMTVKIYDGNLPSGVSKPSAPKIDGSSPNRGWDPTDPDPNNPWNR